MIPSSQAAADRQAKTQVPAETQPGAIVIGGDYQGLGIVRSLGQRGVPICVIDDERSISRYSRYVTHVVHVPDLRNDDSIIKELLALGQRLNLKGWVLFPTRDEVVAAISRRRAELLPWFRVPTPCWESIQWVWDKRSTCEIARKLQLPIPATWNPQSVADLAQVTAPFPLAVKPAIKEHFFYTTRAKGWSASDPEELSALFQRAQEIAGADEILIQDMIPGGGAYQFGYCAFFKDGEAVASMVSRRRRQHPHDFGRASTFVETVDHPEIEALSMKLLSGINYYGLVEVEFKEDPRDGQFKLLDINARTWGYHTLGAAAGVDFPYVLYCDQIGKPVSPARARPGASWMRMLTDFPTAILDIANGRISFSEYFRTLRTFDTEAVFSLRDPLPGIMECLLLPYLIIKRGF
jgi:predicted ATP-grasp superfamily ATP-dependent carboligase